MNSSSAIIELEKFRRLDAVHRLSFMLRFPDGLWIDESRFGKDRTFFRNDVGELVLTETGVTEILRQSREGGFSAPIYRKPDWFYEHWSNRYFGQSKSEEYHPIVTRSSVLKSSSGVALKNIGPTDIFIPPNADVDVSLWLLEFQGVFESLPLPQGDEVCFFDELYPEDILGILVDELHNDGMLFRRNSWFGGGLGRIVEKQVASKKYSMERLDDRSAFLADFEFWRQGGSFEVDCDHPEVKNVVIPWGRSSQFDFCMVIDLSFSFQQGNHEGRMEIGGTEFPWRLKKILGADGKSYFLSSGEYLYAMLEHHINHLTSYVGRPLSKHSKAITRCLSRPPLFHGGENIGRFYVSDAVGVEYSDIDREVICTHSVIVFHEKEEISLLLQGIMDIEQATSENVSLHSPIVVPVKYRRHLPPKMDENAV